MPAVIVETYESGAATVGPESPSVDLHYAVVGTESDLEVRALVEATIPALIRGMLFRNYRIEHKGAGVWDVVARYAQEEVQGADPPPDGGDPVTPDSPLGPNFTFETTGGTQHVSQSLQTVANHAKPGKVAPNFKGAIGFNGEAVEGTDVTVPVFRFTLTYSIPVALVTFTYAVLLFRLTGRVNTAPFKGFAAGEVLFLGASGSRRGVEAWEITYSFAASPNAVNLTVGDIVGVNKKGWEYLWVRYADVEDQNVLVKQPESVHVERVYESGNFALLGIGA